MAYGNYAGSSGVPAGQVGMAPESGAIIDPNNPIQNNIQGPNNGIIMPPGPGTGYTSMPQPQMMSMAMSAPGSGYDDNNPVDPLVGGGMTISPGTAVDQQNPGPMPPVGPQNGSSMVSTNRSWISQPNVRSSTNPYYDASRPTHRPNNLMGQDPGYGNDTVVDAKVNQTGSFNPRTPGGPNNWINHNGTVYHTDENGNPTTPFQQGDPGAPTGGGVGGGSGAGYGDPPYTNQPTPGDPPPNIHPPAPDDGTGLPPGNQGPLPPGGGTVPPPGTDPGGTQFGGQADYGSVQQYADQAYENSRRYLDPMQEQQNRRMEQDLINKGLDPNSEQGRAMMDQMQRGQSDQNSQAMFNSLGFGQGIQDQYFQQGFAQQGQDYNQWMGLENLGYRNQMYGDSRSDYQDALTMALMGMTPVPGMTPQNPAGYAGQQGGYQPGWLSGM